MSYIKKIEKLRSLLESLPYLNEEGKREICLLFAEGYTPNSGGNIVDNLVIGQAFDYGLEKYLPEPYLSKINDFILLQKGNDLKACLFHTTADIFFAKYGYEMPFRKETEEDWNKIMACYKEAKKEYRQCLEKEKIK